MPRRRKNLGDWGETQACKFLERHGFKIIERNYHTTMGEIDVIAAKSDDYYFIEVKTRRDSELAHDDSITYTKKRRMAKTVRAYCYARNIKDKAIIMAGLITQVKQAEKKVGFRFYVIS
ncbi:MAG: YraN family protein [Candidatus Magasanikbacteria bacterium]|nr:YraN family protein [Candidatus Magasanikbacteria bacterium]